MHRSLEIQLRIVFNRFADTLPNKQMKQVAWLLKNVLLPLTPFLVGALIRFVQAGKFSWECLSVTELAFSMALMFLILTSSTTKIQDAALKNSLNSGFNFSVVVFIALFAVGLFLEADIQVSLQDFFATATSKLNASQPLSLSDLPSAIARDQGIVARIRFITMSLSALSIILAVVVGIKYELMDS